MENIALVFPLASQRTIKRALTLLENHLREPGVAFTSTPFSRDWIRLQLANHERELFMVMFLDNQNRLLAHETLFHGTINSTAIYPREVVKAALRHNAAAVILAHNHPSGFAQPSDADRNITERMKKALTLVDVRLLDHLVVGSKEVVSFTELGWL
ncbi:DNA repair protein RadC [Pantoea sp. B9002]|uniref:RadC family protein n=1 Tax=Pantoea sp. B9002 TaxID=2726979 RepID=UPI0015A02D3A|nr:DNA repair protein RadC [Pantoea sp. B9002]NWA61603.1 DNA repair protein RadC [Pantoea sp. B9002]